LASSSAWFLAPTFPGETVFYWNQVVSAAPAPTTVLSRAFEFKAGNYYSIDVTLGSSGASANDRSFEAGLYYDGALVNSVNFNQRPNYTPFSMRFVTDEIGYDAAREIRIEVRNKDSKGTIVSFYIIDITITEYAEIPQPDPDEEFRDEQRGFWAKVLVFLQNIVDGIKAIPQAIQDLANSIKEFFQKIFDFFAMLFRWISFIFRLVVKAMEIMMAISSSLPFWIIGAFVALVAVCVRKFGIKGRR